jgi:hypothetical protein
MSKKTHEEAQAFIDSLAITKLKALEKALSAQDAPYISSKGEIPPYLNKKHRYYSTELATSVEVWLKLFESGEDIKNQSVTLVNQIKAALEKKGFKHSRENSRLATAINPDYNKRGGGTHAKKKTTSKRTVKK